MDIQNGHRVKADHGRDFHPLPDHMTKLVNFTKGEIREFSAFPFSLQQMLDQAMLFLIISQKLHTTFAQTST